MSSPQPSPALGVATVVLTLVGWASVPLFLRHFASSIDAWTSNGWRYGFSALVWLPVLIAVWLVAGLPKRLWRAALVPSVVNAAGQVCFTWAHYRIEPGLLTFGLRSQLIFVAIGAWIMFPRERAIIRTPGYLIGAAVLLIGMAGIVVFAEPPVPEAGLLAQATGMAWGPMAQAQGIGLALLSGLLFAAYGLAVRKYMHGVNSVLAFAAICQYTAIGMVVLMLALGDRAGMTVLNMPGNQILMLLGSALIGIAFGHMWYYMSIARLGVAVTAGVLQLQPFLVAIGSMALFDETLSGWQWAGGFLAVAGAIMMLGVQWLISARTPALQEPAAIAEGESGT